MDPYSPPGHVQPPPAAFRTEVWFWGIYAVVAAAASAVLWAFDSTDDYVGWPATLLVSHVVGAATVGVRPPTEPIPAGRFWVATIGAFIVVLVCGLTVGGAIFEYGRAHDLPPHRTALMGWGVPFVYLAAFTTVVSRVARRRLRRTSVATLLACITITASVGLGITHEIAGSLAERPAFLGDLATAVGYIGTLIVVAWSIPAWAVWAFYSRLSGSRPA